MKTLFQKKLSNSDYYYHEDSDSINFTSLNSWTSFSEEVSFFEILKLIENPDDYINSELPSKIESIISSKKDESFSDPIMIADISRVLIQHLKWVKCFPIIKPLYKVSSNKNQELLKMIKKLGLNFICENLSEIEDINKAEAELEIVKNNLNDDIKLNNNNINQACLNYENFSSKFSKKIIIASEILKDLEVFKTQGEEAEGKQNFLKEKIKQNEIKAYICNDKTEIYSIKKSIDKKAKILLKLKVDSNFKIPRSERNKISKILEEAEENDIAENIVGLSIDCKNKNNNPNENKNEEQEIYLKADGIYEFFKRARELFDEAEEFGVDLQIFDIGSPEEESLFNAEYLKLFNESIEYFFSDLKIEFIAQLGKFFSAPVFNLLIRNPKRLQENYNNNTNSNSNSSSNLDCIYNTNLKTDNSSNIDSSDTENSQINIANLIGDGNININMNMNQINSTEISGNMCVSEINSNSNYFYDIDFLPMAMEENLNSIIFNNEENEIQNFNSNFPEELLLNNSDIICNRKNSIYTNNNINSNGNCYGNGNINCDINYNLIDFLNENNINNNNNENLINNNTNNNNDINNNINCFIEIENKESIIQNLYEKKNNNNFNFNQKLITKFNKKKEKENSNLCFKKIMQKDICESKQKENLSKINCEIKKCLNNKIHNLINNETNQNAFQDWFLYENAGDYQNCKTCEFNDFHLRTKVTYINNNISIKLEKYYYVIMNKFES
jgi:hypothetical protein